MARKRGSLRSARLNQLGLVEDPFKLSADPRYLYLGEEHLAAYRQADNAVLRRRGLVLITGEAGTGKSSLARRMYDLYRDEDDILIVYIPTANFKTATAAAKNIASALEDLEIPIKRSFANQIEELQKGIVRAYESDRNVVLVLDDAQLMKRDALEVIHEFYNFDFDEKLLQVLCFGQEETRSLFQQYPSVDKRVFVRMSLPPLSLPSASSMVNFRLRTAGRKANIFDDVAFEMLYEASGGIPRDIVRLCALATDRMLEDGLDRIESDIMQEIVDIGL